MLADFTAARRHIIFTLTLKLSFWRQLPWILFGLAHHIPTAARECGRRALSLARNLSDEALRALPWFAQVILVAGSGVHGQFLDFVGILTPLRELPALERIVALFPLHPNCGEVDRSSSCTDAS